MNGADVEASVRVGSYGRETLNNINNILESGSTKMNVKLQYVFPNGGVQEYWIENVENLEMVASDFICFQNS